MIFAENGGGAIPVVDVGIDDHGPLDAAIRLQPAYRYGDVMNSTEAFAMVGVSVVETSAKIAAKSVLHGALGSKDRFPRQRARTHRRAQANKEPRVS